MFCETFDRNVPVAWKNLEITVYLGLKKITILGFYVYFLSGLYKITL